MRKASPRVRPYLLPRGRMSHHHRGKHALGRREQVVDGDTGHSRDEARAYKVCVHLSCANEACVKKWMYRNDPSGQKNECGPLFQRWKECFEGAKRGRTVK